MICPSLIRVDKLVVHVLQSLWMCNRKRKTTWSSRVVRKPGFETSMDEHKISWVHSFSYLGYYLTSKLGWVTMIKEYKRRIRRRVAIEKCCTLGGTSSREFRKIIFNSYVMPLFTWTFSIFPLFTNYRWDDFGHFYYTCLKGTVRIHHLNDVLFSPLHNEKSLEERCETYWRQYIYQLGNSYDKSFLCEHAGANA
jgi:hypothetical protein